MQERVAALKTELREAALRAFRTHEFVRSLIVIPSANKYLVEVTHAGARILADALWTAAASLGYRFLIKPTRVEALEDRVLVAVEVSILDENGMVLLSVERLGEDMLQRKAAPNENAVRAAETRAFKRAVAILVSEVEDRLIAYSDWVTQRAMQLQNLSPYERAQKVQQELIAKLEQKLSAAQA